MMNSCINKWVGVVVVSLSLFVFSLAGQTATPSPLSDKIASSYSDLFDYILKLMPETQNLPKSAKQEMQNQFSLILQERFSEDELTNIESMQQKLGGENLVKMLDVFMNTFSSIVQNKDYLKDVQLNLTPSYNALLDKKFSEEKLEEKLQSYYIQDNAKNNKTEGKNLREEATKFSTIGIKYLKKAVSETFSEEQYQLSYDFEHSDLGKRLSDAFEEGMAKAMANVAGKTN
jgi:hypothetical protein